MTKRSQRRTLALGAALGLAATPTMAAGPVPPGFIWIGQASSGTGAGDGGAGNAGAGTGAAGTGTAGTGTNGAGVGATGTGVGNGTGVGGATGTAGTGDTGAGTAAPGAAGTGSTNDGTGANNGTTANGVGSTTNGTAGNGVGTTNGGTAANATNNGGSTGTSGARGSVPLTDNGAPQTFTLAQTIAAALKTSADVETATRNVQIDRARSDEAAAAGRPNVNASGTAIRYDQATKIAIGPGPAIQVTPTHQEILQFNVGNRFDLTGQIRAASDQARLQSLADQFILGQISNARILRAQTVYFDTLRAQHQVDVAQAALTNANRQLTDAANLNAAGVGQKIDVLRAQTQVANAQQNLAAAQNNYGIAQSSFNDLVGRPLDAVSTPSDPPGVVFLPPVTDFSRVGSPDPKATPPLPDAPAEVAAINVPHALRTADAQRPEILAAQVNVRVAQTGIKLARAGLEPTFSLNAAGNYYPTPSFQFPRQRTAQLSATLTIPLYDAGLTRDRVQEARLRTENAGTSLASTRSDVALDVRQAYLNLATAAQQIGAANAALQSAVAARQLAELRYRGQVGVYLEVTDAQSALVQAENAQVDAVYNFLVARAQFQNAVGTPQQP